MTKEAKNLICTMLNPDPVARITATDALKNPWISVRGEGGRREGGEGGEGRA